MRWAIFSSCFLVYFAKIGICAGETLESFTQVGASLVPPVFAVAYPPGVCVACPPGEAIYLSFYLPTYLATYRPM